MASWASLRAADVTCQALLAPSSQLAFPPHSRMSAPWTGLKPRTGEMRSVQGSGQLERDGDDFSTGCHCFPLLSITQAPPDCKVRT